MSLPTSREFVTRLFNSLPVIPRSLAHDINTNIGISDPLDVVPETTKKQLLALHVLFPNELLPALDLLDRRLVTQCRIRNNFSDEAREPVPRLGEAVFPDAPTESAIRNSMETEAEVRTVDGDANIEQRGDTTTLYTITQPTAGLRDTSSMSMPATAPVVSESERKTHFARTPTTHMKGISTKDKARKGHDTVYYVRSAQQRSSRFSTSYESTISYEVRLQSWNCSCPAFAFAAFPAAFDYTFPSSTFPAPSPTHHNKDEQGPGDRSARVLKETKEEKKPLWSFGGVSLGTTSPVCKHLLACVLAERVGMLENDVEEKVLIWEEAAGWAAGWGD